jgi:GPH family glycoside/pentoside/hexuronide:cation symporter
MKIWRTGFIIMAVAFIPLFFVNSLVPTIAIAAVVGIGVAACLTTMDCIGAKIVDDDYRKHGVKREGIINSLMGVMNRLNGLYISLAFFVTSELFGFNNGDDPGENPALAAKVLLCVFPAVAMIIASVVTFLLKFPEDKKDE